MIKLIQEIIGTFIGVLGFAIFFNLERKYWILIAFLGSLEYFIYFAIMKLFNNVFIASLIAAALIELIVFFVSKLKKAPRIIFSTPIMISLVPGGLLYYTARYLMTANNLVSETAINLILTALGLASGRAIISAAIKFIHNFRKRKDQ